VADIYYCACTSGVCYTLNTFYKANSRVLAAEGDSVPTSKTPYTLILVYPRPYTLRPYTKVLRYPRFVNPTRTGTLVKGLGVSGLGYPRGCATRSMNCTRPTLASSLPRATRYSHPDRDTLHPDM